MSDEAERAWEAPFAEWSRIAYGRSAPTNSGHGLAYRAGYLAATAAQSRTLSDEDVERAAREYERRIFKHEWEDDEQWTPTHTLDAIAAMRSALATLPARPLPAEERASAGVAGDAAAEVVRLREALLVAEGAVESFHTATTTNAKGRDENRATKNFALATIRGALEPKP